MTQQQQLLTLFASIQAQLQALQLWQHTRPDESQLESAQPFAMDKLAPEAWLQWIFVDKMTAMIENGEPLPSGFAIAPYFEQCWQSNSDYQPLLELIRQVDEVCQ